MSRFKFYPQRSPDDCGVSALRMVSAYHGRDISSNEIRSLASVPYGDLSILALSRVSEQLGFQTLSLKLSSGQLNEQIQFPAIAHTQGQHYVVIERMSSAYLDIADPAYGRYRLSVDDFQDRWMDQGQGVILVMEPSARFVKRQNEQEKESESRVLDLAWPDRWSWVHFLLEGFILVTFLQVFRYLTDSVYAAPSTHWWVVGAFLLLLMGALLHLHRRWTKLKSDRSGDLPIESAFTGTGGDPEINHPLWLRIMQRISFDWYTKSISQILDQYRAGTHLLFLLIYLIWLEPITGLAFLLLGLVLWGIEQYTSRRALGQMVLAYEAEFDHWQAWDGLDTDHPGGLQNQIWNSSHRPGRLFSQGMMRWIGLCWLLLVLCSYSLVPYQGLEFGHLVVCAIAGIEALHVWLLGQRARLVAHMQLCGWDLTSRKAGQETASELEGDLSLEIPTFQEDGAVAYNPIIRLPAGKASLVFGTDHPYKMQVFNHLIGWSSGEEAQLRIGPQILDASGLRRWESSRMKVQRMDRLSWRTMGELITGRPDFEPEDPRLKEVLDACILSDPLRELPDGLNSVIGPDDWQTQWLVPQILTARALYQRPAWLFLDDVFGHLEPFQEQVLIENIVLSRAGLATVIFSRRLELAGVVDWIVHIREGQVVEQGAFIDLLDAEGYFYSLITSD